MNRQSIVGLVTILGLLGLFFIFFELSNIGTSGRYLIGVHFKSASGIHKGALVYESGVNVGLVDSLKLLPEDFTVDVILAINNTVDIPRDARYIIQAPLTGDATLEIVPKAPQPRPAGIAAPTPAPGAIAVLPHSILPLEQQPLGTNPATLTDLLQEGQGEVTRLDALLVDLEQREPQLLNTFQSALSNANEISVTMNAEVQKLSRELDAIQGPLGQTLATSTRNIVDITSVLDRAANTDSKKIDGLFAQLDTMSRSLNVTVDQVRDLATNPQVKQNLLDTTKGIAETTTTIAALTGDLRNITGNPQTQAQLRDTVANINAVTQKTNSLLGSLGGRSSVYGVDPGATPAPITTPIVLPPGSTRVPGPYGSPSASGTPGPMPAQAQLRLANAARNLLAIQIRVAELNMQKAHSSSSPLLTQDRGPQTDINAVLLPHGSTRALIGANDIGSNGTSTFNLAASTALGTSGLRIGAGVLYSRLGFLGEFANPRIPLGVEARLYDPRHPTLDGYIKVRAAQGVEIFGGERDATHSGRRTVFGLQLQF